MNRESDERQIRELFRELREADAETAPPFPAAWLASQSRRPAKSFRRRLFRFVIVAAADLNGIIRALSRYNGKDASRSSAGESRGSDNRVRRSKLRLAIGIAGLLLVFGIVREIAVRLERQQVAPQTAEKSADQVPNGTATAGSQDRAALPVSNTEHHVAKNGIRVSGGRARRHDKPKSTVVISQWRSPTSSLLRVPGENLLNQVPRLGEPIIEINLPSRIEKD